MSSGQKDEDCTESFQAEDGHRESQAEESKVRWKKKGKRNKPSDGDIEGQSLRLPVDGGDGPCDTDTKEDIDSIGASDVTDRVVSGFILNSSSLRGEGI